RGPLRPRGQTRREEAHLTLAAGASALLGGSGRTRGAALRAGRPAPQALADVATGRRRATRALLAPAGDGRVTPPPRVVGTGGGGGGGGGGRAPRGRRGGRGGGGGRGRPPPRAPPRSAGGRGGGGGPPPPPQGSWRQGARRGGAFPVPSLWPPGPAAPLAIPH